MAKRYIICNANTENGELNLFSPRIETDYHKAISFCKDNLAEDFGCDSYEELKEDYSPSEYEYDSNLLYEISCDNLGGHEEIYKIFVEEF